MTVVREGKKRQSGSDRWRQSISGPGEQHFLDRAEGGWGAAERQGQIVVRLVNKPQRAGVKKHGWEARSNAESFARKLSERRLRRKGVESAAETST